jgi:putative Mn2+ efflux pump MntP
VDLASVLLVALGLSLDALAVSISCGFVIPDLRASHALRIGAFFGGFQVLMPVLGWLGGLGLRRVIAGFDHWVAFGLLALVGAKMIRDGVRGGSDEERLDPRRLGVLLVLAVATSIDALAVGLSFSLLAADIVFPVVVIGVVTFTLSFLGVFAGRRFGRLLGEKIEIAGGLILLGIGARILAEHLG